VCDWLGSRDLDVAHSFLRHFPAEAMTAWPAPLAPRRSAASTAAPVPVNGELF
jgi:hypothetical protein